MPWNQKTTRMKYRNKRVKLDGYTFDSKAEARKYSELKLMQRVGGPEGVKTFTVHPRFELLPAFQKDGSKYRATHYIADFDVTYNDGRREIIDIKGVETAVFRIKAKMFDLKYPHLRLVVEKV